MKYHGAFSVDRRADISSLLRKYRPGAPLRFSPLLPPPRYVIDIDEISASAELAGLREFVHIYEISPIVHPRLRNVGYISQPPIQNKIMPVDLHGSVGLLHDSFRCISYVSVKYS